LAFDKGNEAYSPQLYGTGNDNIQYPLIGVAEYDGGRAVKVSSDGIALQFEHKEVEGWSDRHIDVTYKDINDVGHDDKLAYLSEVQEVSTMTSILDESLNLINSLLPSKANIYSRISIGITTGNNLQGTHIEPKDPFLFFNEWSLIATDGSTLVRTNNSLVFTPSGGSPVVLVDDGTVQIANYIIEDPFVVSQITGVFVNTNLLYRYFDIKDFDQRIGVLSALTTTDKTSVVNAMNSLKEYVDTFLNSSEADGSPYDNYADFLAGAGATVQPGKYAYVSFPTLSGVPQAAPWDSVGLNDTWRIDCGETAWKPTTNMTAQMTATLLDQASNPTLLAAGNNSIQEWLQSFRNNLKSLFDTKVNKNGTDRLMTAAEGTALSQTVTTVSGLSEAVAGKQNASPANSGKLLTGSTTVGTFGTAKNITGSITATDDIPTSNAVLNGLNGRMRTVAVADNGKILTGSSSSSYFGTSLPVKKVAITANSTDIPNCTAVRATITASIVYKTSELEAQTASEANSGILYLYPVS
jgi:hypothetical protein